MKRYLMVLALTVACFVGAFSQSTSSFDYTVSKSYGNTTVDTLALMDFRDYTTAYLSMVLNDSGFIYAKYQLSPDGTNWGSLSTIDSVSSTGTVSLLNRSLTTQVLNAPFFRIVANTDTSKQQNGVTSATYKVKIVLKRP